MKRMHGLMAAAVAAAMVVVAAPATAREVVQFTDGYSAGTIVVRRSAGPVVAPVRKQRPQGASL